MYIKLFIFLGLLAISSIEARNFLKKLRATNLETAFLSKSSTKAVEHIRSRRSTETDDDEEEVDLDPEEIKLFLRFLVQAAWEGDKLEVLGGLLEEMSDSETNITVIGWQRVYNADGKVEEIDTIQFVIPPKPDDDSSNNVVDDDVYEEDDDRYIDYDTINELNEALEPLEALGLPASVTSEEYDTDNQLSSLLYKDKDELYGYAEGFSIYNRTRITTAEEVSNFIASLKPKALGKPSILKYDENCQLLKEQSNIRPHILGSVIDYYNATDPILRESPEIIAVISQTVPRSEVPKALAQKYNEEFPEFKWRVLVDPENYYVTRDVTVTLTFDNFDLDETSDISYLVYGTLKQ